MTPIEPANILGLILAGGQSRRMDGVEKSLLQLGAKPLAQWVRDALLPQVGSIALNANGDPERFAALGLPVIADRISGAQGPLAGIHAGMAYARQTLPDVSHVLSVPADTPFIPANLAESLAKAASAGHHVSLAGSCGSIHPAVGLWPVSLAGELEAFLAAGSQRRVLAFAQACGHASVEFALVDRGGKQHDPFFNINTALDLQAARNIAGN